MFKHQNRSALFPATVLTALVITVVTLVATLVEAVAGIETYL